MHDDRRPVLCESAADWPGGFSPAETVVLKVGGSLLDCPELPHRLSNWLRQNSISQPLVIVGGGAAADAVRSWDRTYQLGEERAHQLAVESMGLTRLLLRELLDDSVVVWSRDAARAAWAARKIPILDVSAFLQTEEAVADLPLPHSWSVTSDSIAVWVTRVWPARQLVLGKSVPLPKSLETGTDDRQTAESRLAALADNGMTDRSLPELARGIPQVGWLCLRDECPRYQLIARIANPAGNAPGAIVSG